MIRSGIQVESKKIIFYSVILWACFFLFWMWEYRMNGDTYGTTEYVARMIQEITGGDIHLIQTQEMYPADLRIWRRCKLSND